MLPKRENKPRYWAVKYGFEGPRIYSSWDGGAQLSVEGYPGAWFKGFRTLELATTWLDETDPSLAQDPLTTSNIVSRTPAPGRSPKRPYSNLFNDFDQRHAGKHESPTKRHNTWPLPTVDSPEALDIPLRPNSPEFTSVSAGQGVVAVTDPTPPPVPSREPEITIKKEESLNEIDLLNEAGPSSEKPHASECLAPPSADITLSPQQQYILDRVLAGESLFFTGSAGTGKSVLLREIIRRLRDDPARAGKVAVTASTGIAAVNIGGSTLHSFAGCGLAKESAEVLGNKIRGSSAARRWRQTSVLVIDEISMIDGTLFDKLEHVARIARRRSEPFGGLQLVLCGDFYQLPPVPEQYDGLSLPVLFAFEADSWKRCVPRTLMLTHVFRQKEQEFIDILNDMRLGNLDNAAVARFRQLEREVVYADGLLPTELYPTRKEVDNANSARLKGLPHSEKRFVARDFPGYDVRGEKISQKEATKLLERLVAPQVLILKVGAQVMLIQNLVQGKLVNGTIGRVIDFMTIQQANEARLEVARLERANTGPSYGPQQTPTPSNSELDGHQWPVVEFENGHTALCPPTLFSVTNVFGREEASRDQVPLIAAWAMSIHKSQGQTLGRVKVDLGRIFEKGQAYVAISRATSLESLQILNFQPARVQAHIRVVEFSKQLLKSGVIPIEPGDSAMPQSTASHSHEDDDETQDSTSEEWMSAC